MIYDFNFICFANEIFNVKFEDEDEVFLGYAGRL